MQPSLRRAPTVTRAFAEALLGGRLASRVGLGELIMEHEPHERPGPASWATGAAMLISTRAAAEIGPWDESFLLYGEETEYALRAADRGWALWYEPEAVMMHVGGTQTVTNADLFALLVVNRVRLFRARHGRMRSLTYQAAVVLGELVRAAAGRPTAAAALRSLLLPSHRMRELPQ
jgi:GT2 family glycosyltransferase